MTKDEQAEFVRGLAASVTDKVLKIVASGAVPHYWDGHELRELLAEAFEAESTLRDKRFVGRLRAYRKDGARFAWR